MAKDVDLVIRARDEASKAVKTIESALESFVGTQRDVQSGAAKTGSVLERLKSEFTALDRTASALTGFQKVQATLERAGSAVDRLTKSVDRQETELAGLKTKADELQRTEDRLRASSTASAAALDKQKTALATLKGEASAATSEITKLERSLAALEKTRAPTTNPRSSVVGTGLTGDRLPSGTNIPNQLPGTSARDSARVLLQGELQQARVRQAGLLAAVSDETGILDKEAKSLDEINDNIRAVSGASRELQGEVQSVSAALERELKSLVKAADAYGDLSDAAKEANESLSRTKGLHNQIGVDANRSAITQQAAQERIARSIERRGEHEAPIPVPARLAAGVEAARAELERSQTALSGAQAAAEAAPAAATAPYAERLRAASSAAQEASREVKASLREVESAAGAATRQIAGIESALRKLDSADARPRARGVSEGAFAQAQSERAEARDALNAQLATLRQQQGEAAGLASTERARLSLTHGVAADLKEQERSVRAIEQTEAAIATAQRRVTAVAGRRAQSPLEALGYGDSPFSARRSATAFAQGDLEKAQAAHSDAMERHASILAKGTGVAADEITGETDTIRALRSELTALIADTNRANGVTAALTAEVKDEAAALREVADAEQRIAQARARVSASQASVQARIEGLSAKRAPVAPATDESPLNRQKLEAYRGFTDAQKAVTDLARAMRDADAPTDEMGAALGRAQAAARVAKLEYLALAEALQKVRNGTSQQDGSFGAFSARIAKPQVAAAAMPSGTNIPPIAAMAPAGGEARQSGGDFAAGAAGAKSFGDALKGIYGDSRESLSLLQRLRGEVLALTASFVGFQGAIQGIKYVLEVFQALEAAQSRLGAVFNQDTQRVGFEIDFIRRNADRLGISFSTLSNEYGKFAIAAQSANLASADTRKLFLAVAEAGVVNRLSNEQVSKTFLALTQMMSKGSIQSEELKGQLGDALPGALGIFASALGVTTKQLEGMLQRGEVLANSSNLMDVADELTKRFGPQLASSLTSTTAQMGRFQNSLQEAALQVASGGLIDGFTTLLIRLNEFFKSDTGREFFLSLGSAAQTLLNGIAALVPYLGQIKTALGLIVAVKVGSAFLSLGGVLKSNVADIYKSVTATGALSAAQTGATATTARLAIATGELNGFLLRGQIGLTMMGDAAGVAGGRFAIAATGMGVLRTVVTGTAAAMRGLLAAFGGIAGLVVTGLTVAAGYWLTSVDSATDALVAHKALIDTVVAKYDEAKDKASDWAKTIKGASAVQISAEIDKATAAYDQVRKSMSAPTAMTFGMFGEATTEPVNESLTKLVTNFKDGKVKIEDFTKAVNDIATADPSLDKVMLADLIKLAQKTDDAKENVDKLKAVLALLKGTATDAQKALLGTADSLKDMGTKKLTADMQAFNDALNDVKQGIPAYAVQLQKAKEQADALAAALKAVQAANGDIKLIQQATDVYEKRQGQISENELKGYLKQYGGDKNISPSLVNEIYGSEGMRSAAYKDQGGKPTIGFGSTTLNGQPVKMGDVVNMQQAVEQMVTDLSKFTAMVDSATGNAKLTENQRNALTSYVYNVGNTNGSAPTRAIFDAVRQNKPDEEVSRLIANGVATVNGVENSGLRDRRRREAALYTTRDDRTEGNDSGATEYDRNKAKIDAQRKFDEATTKQVDRANRSAGDQKKINDADNQTTAKREVAIQTALIEAQNRAKEEGANLSKQQEEAIKASTSAEYDQLHINDQAKEAEEKVNSLYKLRQQLLEELKVAKEQGDGTQIAATKTSIETTNASLRESIALAIKYWQAIGGTEADTAISKLKIMENQTLKNKTQILTAGQANEMLASGMTRAFDTAAQGIGKAIAGTGSWTDAIKGVGTAFLNFAADFLREIANMILKQIILNALQSAMGSGGGGVGGGIASIANAAVAIAHTGGIVGSGSVGVGNGTRMVNPAWFSNAARYHQGGIAGLQPGEVPTILKRNEEVLTENDPRHAMNGGRGGGGSAPQSIKSVLVMDPNMIPDAMSAPAGEQVVLSHIKSNRATIKKLLG